MLSCFGWRPRRIGRVVLWSGLWCALAGACAGARDFDVSEAYCSNLCGRWNECQAGYDEASCFDDCLDLTPSMTWMRSEAAKPLGSCIGSLSCAELTDDLAFDDCFERTGAALTITEASRRFCEGYARRVFQCGGYYGEDQCAQEFKLWRDDALGRFGECLDSACDSISACFSSVLEVRR